MDHLAYLDASLEQHEERRELALVDQPITGAQADVGPARGQRLELGRGQRREERDAAKKVDGNHLGRVRSMSARSVAHGRVSARPQKRTRPRLTSRFASIRRPQPLLRNPAAKPLIVR